jgi:hypothetical protein
VGLCPTPQGLSAGSITDIKKGGKAIKPTAKYRIKLTTRVGLLLSIALFGRNKSIPKIQSIQTKPTQTKGIGKRSACKML